MEINRRTFVAVTVGMLSGCATGARESGTPSGRSMPGRWVDAGPIAAFTTDGVYAAFRDAGFFVVRQGGELYAVSAVCTHRDCKLRPKPDRSFFCPCHGSRFDLAGHVTHGPATRDLPRLPTTVDERGRLFVRALV